MNAQQWQERADAHMKTFRHPAIATAAGWWCLEPNCNVGEENKPTPAPPTSESEPPDDYYTNWIDGEGF